MAGIYNLPVPAGTAPPDGPGAFLALANRLTDFRLVEPFDSATDRDTAHPSPVDGQLCYRTDRGWFEAYCESGVTTPDWYPVARLPFARASSAAATIPDSTATAIGGTGHAWTEISDVQGWHSPSSNPTRWTPTVAGRFAVTFGAQFGLSGTGMRYIQIRRNGTAVPGAIAHTTQPGFVSDLTLSMRLTLAAGDYIECYAWQSSGGALTVETTLAIDYLGPV